MAGTEIRPLAQVRLAQDHRTRFAKPSRHKGVLARNRSHQCERPGCGHHSVVSGDIVLDEHRESMERPPQPARFALAVQCLGDGQRIRIDFDDRIQLGTFSVHTLDALQIRRRNRARSEAPGLDATPELGERDFLKFKPPDPLRPRILRRHQGRHCAERRALDESTAGN